MPLFSFINIQKYSLKSSNSLATIFVKTNTLGDEKHFNPWKSQQRFCFYSVPYEY